MIYTVTLNPALDYIVRLSELQSKDINRADSAEVIYGGKGINVSLVLKELGLQNKALGFVAGFTGRGLQDMLQADGVETDFVELPSGLTRINVKLFAQEQWDVNAPGPKVDAGALKEFYEKIDTLRAGDILVMAGAVPENLPEDIYELIMQKLQGRGIRIVVDTSGEALRKVLPYQPFLIKPNHHELSDLFGQEVLPTDEILIVKLAKRLQEMGAANVLVSRGKYGAILVDENCGIHSAGIVPGKPVNNVGCGDSMVAGFVAGYEMKQDYDYALRLGSAAGNASAFVDGIASGTEIRNTLDQYFSK
jgi:1-phosphofructokinase